MNEDCEWKETCEFCETYGHCAVEVHDIHYRNGRIDLVQIISPHAKDINIIGIVDMRYFEEIENPFQYLVNGELQWEFPENPYPIGTAQYANHQDMVESLPSYEELIEIIIESSGAGLIDMHEGYNIRVEKIGNYNDLTGIAAKISGNKAVDSDLINSYCNFDLLPTYLI